MIISLYFLLSIGLALLYYCTFNTYYKGWQNVDISTDIKFGSDDTVTVVIAGRNEENNITRLLKAIRDQQYAHAHWEIILVNDHSEDQMVEKASNLGLKNLKIINNPIGKSGKKAALNTAIHNSNTKYILFTDADCHMDPYWIESMIGCLKSTNNHMVTGLVNIQRNTSFHSQFQSIDMAGMMVVSGGAIQNKTHAMANGANMAVVANKLPRFDVLKGTSKASGDDMFLAQHFLAEDKLAFNKDLRALVKTEAQKNWIDILLQRRRWASKNAWLDGIKTKSNFAIIIGFYINILISLFSYFWIGPSGFAVFILSMIIKMSADHLLLKEGCDYINLDYRSVFLFKAQPMQIWITLSAFFSAIFKIPFVWKGRTYR